MAGWDFQPTVYVTLAGMVGVACTCGWRQEMDDEMPLLAILNAIGEHNSRTHLTTDNQRLKSRGR